MESTSTKVLKLLRGAGKPGMTSPEMETALSLNHGKVSGATSRLEAEGLVARLEGTYRATSIVYVASEHLYGRRTGKARRKSGTPAEAIALDFANEDAVAAAFDAGHAEGRLDGMRELLAVLSEHVTLAEQQYVADDVEDAE